MPAARRLRLRLLVPALGLLAACASPPTPAPEAAPTPVAHRDVAAQGVHSPALAAVLVDHWAHTMRTNPVWATQLGDHRYDDQIADLSEAAHAANLDKSRKLLAAAQAIDAETLSPRDRIYAALFIEHIESEIASEACHFEQWSLSPRGNPVTEWSYLPELMRIETDKHAEDLLARFAKAPASIDQQITNLRRGAAQGWFANRESTRRVIEMVQRVLNKPVQEWAMAKPLSSLPERWSPKAKAQFEAQLIERLDKGIKPALERYLTLLQQDILPNSRAASETGLSALPFGEACYQARIEHFTTVPLTAKQHHEIGMKEIARINAAMAKLGGELFGAESLAQTLERLRTDPKLYFDSAQELEATAQAALDKARAKIPGYFALLPEADCVVTRIPEYEAPYTTIAYYRQPAPDGTKPGEYFINVYKPETRPRYELEALSFHEAIPGHHLQIAIAQERPAVPAFLKHIGMTAFVEGWALYTEQLADEMGLYSGDLDRMGMLSYEAWRASRLVVDTGLHAMGWSRERAKRFMLEHTALAANNIDNEVDRYIVWPGQALAYKTGQMEIWRLRREAEAKLAERFDLSKFHEVVLEQGAVSLPILRRQVEAWVSTLSP